MDSSDCETERERAEKIWGKERGLPVRLPVALDQHAVCSSSHSLTCPTCEAGPKRTTLHEVPSLINFTLAKKKKKKKTWKADSDTHALNTHKINAPPYHSVNKGGKIVLAGK